MKKRISLTINSDILKQLDNFIDNVNFGSRSCFIEFCIKKYIENSNVAVILSGGSPKKLKIGDKFKFLIPIRKNLTLIDLLFEKLKNFSKIYFVGHKEVIDTCFERFGNIVGSAEVEYIEEKMELGNAKTLELVRDKLPNKFLILPIDQYYEFDFFDLLRKHDINQAIYGSIITLVVSPISTKEKYGSVAMLGNKIVKHEEGKEGKKKLISAFAAVCDKKIFDYIPRGELRWVLQENIYPKLIEREAMSGYLIDTPIFNIHTEKDIFKLRKYLSLKN